MLNGITIEFACDIILRHRSVSWAEDNHLQLFDGSKKGSIEKLYQRTRLILRQHH